MFSNASDIFLLTEECLSSSSRHRTAAVNREIRQNVIFLQSNKLKERIGTPQQDLPLRGHGRAIMSGTCMTCCHCDADHVAQLLKDLRTGGAASTQCIVFVNSRDVIDKVTTSHCPASHCSDIPLGPANASSSPRFSMKTLVGKTRPNLLFMI